MLTAPIPARSQGDDDKICEPEKKEISNPRKAPGSIAPFSPPIIVPRIPQPYETAIVLKLRNKRMLKMSIQSPQKSLVIRIPLPKFKNDLKPFFL